jgi:hypothetical protein
MANQATIKGLVGKQVTVEGNDGRSMLALLINVGRASIWIVHGDEDRFLDLADVKSLRPA